MGRIGSFRLQTGDSLMVLGRCNSSILLSEAISEDSHRLATYERISQSMRLSDKELSPGIPSKNKKKQRGWKGISWVFSKPRNDGRDDEIKEEAPTKDSVESGKKKKKKNWRPSWLPEPDRRWPVQGW